MSDQAPEKVDIESGNKNEKTSDIKQKLNKNQEDEEEDDGYSCGKCWGGYCACIVAICRCTYNCIIAVKNGIVTCCSSCWYPVKERCSNCSECCDRKMNPYKDPYYREYDSL